MRSTLEAITVIYEVLNDQIKARITGDLYKLKRPVNSKMEDIVINALPSNEGIIQELALNVNCYVPDISVKIKNQPEQVPNTKRLNEIALMVIDAIEHVSNEDNHFFVTNQTIIQDESGHYANIRVMFFFVNF